MQRFLVGLLALAMFLATPFPGVAQQADGGPHNVIIPQRRVVLPLPDAPVRLESVGVDADIREQVATTTVTIVVRNPGPRPQEAQLLLPVPDGSAVRQFRLEGLPDEGVAKLLPRDEARRIYDDIVRRTLDPGLVEFVGYNLIRTSVFPVPANGTQRLHLTYEQVLPADGERIDYVFPRSESLEASDVKWSMGVTIRAERTVTTVYSPTHEIVTERSPGRIRVTVPERAATEPGAFRLSYLFARSEAGGASASLIAYPDPRVGATAAGAGNGGYFLLLAALPPLENGKDRTIRREVTVVIDRSGSMRGEKMDQAKAAALMIIEALDEGEAFNIIDYSDTIEAFAPQPVLKNAETIARAREYVGAMQAMGGTNIHDALLTALRPPVTEGCLPIVLFLTDGLATVGERREGAIREAANAANTHKRRIFTFGVGFDVNTPLLSALARSSRATSTFVLPKEDVEVKVGQVFRRLRGPILASPALTYRAADPSKVAGQPVRQLMPSELPDVFDGDQLVILGQHLTNQPVTFVLGGTDATGEPRSFEFTFALDKASPQNSFVPRLWASRRIAVLLDEIRQSGADAGLPTRERPEDDPRMKELVDEVIRLSIEYGILTEYTAFLAAEPGTPGWNADGSPQNSLSLGRMLGLARGREDESVQDGVEYSRLYQGIANEAQRERAGSGAVAKDSNLNTQLAQKALNRSNRFMLPGDAPGLEGRAQSTSSQASTVKQAADRTLYQRGTRWVDAEILEHENEEAEVVVEFGTDAYFDLAQRFAREGRQSVLAVQGDLYLLLDGKRTLIKGPA